MKFSEKLKQAMQQLGINQAQVVGLTGKSKGSISMYLNDKTTPSEQVQSDIAVSLGLNPDYFEQEETPVTFKPSKCEDGIPTLTVHEVAKLMHKHTNTIALGLQQGVFPWGYAIHTSEHRWSYFINAKRFAEIEGGDLMPKIEYKSIKFQQKSLELINLVNQVVEEYQAQGYELTLRQAYYQLVARGYIPNNERSYKNIGNLINDGRLAGLIDWYSITDRTRNLRSNSHWDNPADVIASARYSYLLNKWDGQPNYVEVWVEKDALVDIVGQACRPLDTPYFSCRGYTSQSEMWSAAQRFISQDYRDNRVIIHLGDHDPSGIDMTRDIQERLQMFGADVYVKRVALTMNQIGTYNPPPNPAKITDSRASKYIDEYGNESWELDALEPQVITDLITNEVTALRNDEIYRSVCDSEERGKDELKMIERNYDKAVAFLESEE